MIRLVDQKEHAPKSIALRPSVLFVIPEVLPVGRVCFIRGPGEDCGIHLIQSAVLDIVLGYLASYWHCKRRRKYCDGAELGGRYHSFLVGRIFRASVALPMLGLIIDSSPCKPRLADLLRWLGTKGTQTDNRRVCSRKHPGESAAERCIDVDRDHLMRCLAQ
jgi:hypothetical protein